MSSTTKPQRMLGSKTTRDWQALDSRHHLHPFTDHKDLGQSRSRIVQRADGVYVFDADGRKLLDAMSGLWCVNAGYGRDELVQAARRQLEELPYYNSFFQCTTPPAVELAAELIRLSPPGFDRVFFAGSGSESIDTAIRMVRRYWELLEQPERTHIVARVNAYHGSTVAGTSLGGMRAQRAQGGPLLPDISHVAQPYWFGSDRSESPDDLGNRLARDLATHIDTIGADRVAAFFAEPVQGAGGVIIPPDTYWPAVQKVCRERGVLLVCDEVITGFGRLGKWFGCEYFGVRPDLMTFAKGVTSGYLPLGGVIVGERVAHALVELGGEFHHGYTYSGHPACAAVALANLALIERESLVERVATAIGPYLQGRWQELASHPLVGEARMVGLMGAAELVADTCSMKRFDEGDSVGLRCRNLAIENGLIMRAVGDTMIVAPPLVLTHGEADELIEKAWRTLDELHSSLR